MIDMKTILSYWTTIKGYLAAPNSLYKIAIIILFFIVLLLLTSNFITTWITNLISFKKAIKKDKKNLIILPGDKVYEDTIDKIKNKEIEVFVEKIKRRR